MAGRGPLFRRMSQRDLKEVYRINLELFGEFAWSRENLKSEFNLSCSEQYVLEVEGKVVGFIIVWIIRDEALIMLFGVDKSYQGKGYGKLILQKLEERLRERVKFISLDVRKSNIKAINLYKKLSYKIVKERKNYYSDGENALYMVKELL